MPDVPEPESLDETYRRLSPYSDAASATTGPPEPPRAYAPPAPEPSQLQPPRSPYGLAEPAQQPALAPPVDAPPPNRLVPILSIAGVAVVLVIAIVVGSIYSLMRTATDDAIALDPDTSTPSSAPAAPQSTSDPVVVDEWTNYPGTAFSESSEALAAPSKEVVVAESEAFLDEFKQALTDDLGVDWSTTWTGMTQQASNGYGGDSLLYDYFSPEWIGTVKLDDPKARQQVRDLLETMTADAGGSDLLFANEVYQDDRAASLEQFGAEDIADQAMWAFSGRDSISPGMSVSSRAYDTNFPTDASFNGDTWFRVDGSRPGMFYVRIQLSTYGLLSEADRDEFEKRIATYDETQKPPSR